MATGFDFNDVQKRYLPVTLADENKTKIFLRSPNKRLLEEFKAVQSAGEDAQDFELVSNLMAKIMSHNRTGYHVSPKDLEDFELDEIMAFFNVYQKFIEGIYNEKN